jgi:hemerythrin-like domain-containing protein
LAQIKAAVEEVAAGRLTPEQARDHINQTTMRQNYWTLGSFCAAYCRVLTMHHTLEDQTFPGLAHRKPELAPVVTKLSQEHEVIADVLTAIDSTLTAMMSDDSRLDDVRDHVHLLDRLLTSHLDYEEDQLVAPLGDFFG